MKPVSLLPHALLDKCSETLGVVTHQKEDNQTNISYRTIPFICSAKVEQTGLQIFFSDPRVKYALIYETFIGFKQHTRPKTLQMCSKR